MTQSNLTEIKIDSDPIAATPRTMESTFMQFIPMILIFIVFYFLLIRPQEKKRKAQEQLINSVKKGDEVITNSGIFGKIVKVNDSDSTLDVQISDGVVVKILKTMIINVISKK
jgi:preprotein translocase subunit YajC